MKNLNVSSTNNTSLKEDINDPKFKYRIVLDMCTPTAERRPTTPEDIVNDIQVIEGSGTLRDLMRKLDYNCFYDPYDYDEYYFDDDNDYNYITSKYSIEYILEEMLYDWRDPSDGSPNVFYIAINGKEIPTLKPLYNQYDSMDEDLLAHGTHDEIVKNLLKIDGYDDYYDEDDEDYYDEDDDYYFDEGSSERY